MRTWGLMLNVTNATYRTGTRQLEIWLYFNGNFSLGTRPVSRICHAGAVANVVFKLCRSWWDDHTTSWKVETSISEAKIVRIHHFTNDQFRVNCG